MNFIHYEIDADDGDAVEVTLDRQANVRILDGSNFSSYRSGRRYRYVGGLAERSPVLVRAPGTGHWHVVVDLQGYVGKVHAAFRVIRA